MSGPGDKIVIKRNHHKREKVAKGSIQLFVCICLHMIIVVPFPVPEDGAQHGNRHAAHPKKLVKQR